MTVFILLLISFLIGVAVGVALRGELLQSLLLVIKRKNEEVEIYKSMIEKK